MRLSAASLASTAIALLALTGCAAAGGANGSTDSTGTVESSAGVVPDLNGLIDFDAESLQLLWETDDVLFFTDDNVEHPDDICLLPITPAGEDLGGSCTDGSSNVIDIENTRYIYGATPTGSSAWNELAPDFWVQ